VEHRVLFLRSDSLLKILNDRRIQTLRVVPLGKQDDQGNANCNNEVGSQLLGRDLLAIGDSKVEKTSSEESLSGELMWGQEP